MLRNVIRAGAICDDCGTTATDDEGTILVFFDAAVGFAAVTADNGPDGLGPWALVPPLDLLCRDCHARRTCVEVGHDWGPESPCLCVQCHLAGDGSQRSQTCRRCHTVRTTHQAEGGCPMKTALIWTASRLVELLVLVVLPLVLLVLLVVGRFAVVTVLPVLLLVGLAVVSGMVRTTGLLLVGVGAALRLVMVGVDRLAERAPAPRLGVSGR